MIKTNYEHVFVDYKTNDIYINFTILLPSPEIFTDHKSYMNQTDCKKRYILKFNDANGKKFETHLEASLYAYELKQELIFAHLDREYNTLSTGSHIASILTGEVKINND